MSFLGQYLGFSKNDTAFDYGPTISEHDLSGVDEVNVDIVKLGNEFAVNFGGATKVYTVEGMEDRAYAGVFVSRDADITFTNVYAGNEVVEGNINDFIAHNDFSATLNCKNAVDSNAVNNITVTDAEGRPVNPADGKYTLTDGKVYTISANGYVDKKVLAISRYDKRDIALTPVVNITLTEKNNVEFTVKDSNGKVVEPADGGVYALVPGAEYTISAKTGDYKEQKYTAPNEATTNEFTLESFVRTNPQNVTYWFDVQEEGNKKGKYYYDGGIVELFDDFALGGRYTVTNGSHKSYKSANSAYGSSQGTNIGANTKTLPDGGNAFAFTPFANGILRIYGEADTSNSQNIKTYNFYDGTNVTNVTNGINTPYEEKLGFIEMS